VNFRPFGVLSEILPDFGGGRFLENLATRSSLCVAASRELLGLVSRFNENTLYLPTGVDLWRFDGGPVRKPENVTDPVRLLWLGDVWGSFMADNVLYALDAFFAIPAAIRARARFSVIAYGRSKEALISTARKRYGNPRELDFPDRLHPDSVPTAMAQHDIGVFPLHRDIQWTRSKSPTKLFEYMAMRMAIAASPVGEVRSVLTNGEDGLVADSPEAFRDALARLIEDLALRVRLGENARRKAVTRYSLGRLLRSLAGQLDALAQHGEAPRVYAEAEAAPSKMSLEGPSL